MAKAMKVFNSEELRRHILLKLSTAREGMSRQRIFEELAEENSDTYFCHVVFIEMLVKLETSGQIRLGQNRRFYKY